MNDYLKIVRQEGENSERRMKKTNDRERTERLRTGDRSQGKEYNCKKNFFNQQSAL